MFTLKHLGAVLITAVTLAACSGDNTGGESTGTMPSAELDVAPSISPCGGFVGSGSAKIPMPDPATYCEAERLLWNYDAGAKTLGLTNSRIMLNCCGDHSVQVSRDGDTIVFTEIDAPEAAAGGARCNCMCVFDYAADISPIEPGALSIRIVRNVTDQKPPTAVVWEGTIDSSVIEGAVVVSMESAEPWCSNAVK